MWTRFMDMHSGGGTKEPPYEYILIEAPRDEAMVIFYNRFGHNPYRVSCTCCGEDYSITEDETLAQLTAYDRHCKFAYFDPQGNEVERDVAYTFVKGMNPGYKAAYIERIDPLYEQYGHELTPLDEYLKKPDVLVIRAEDIKPEERVGEVPEQGYVWVD